MTPGTKVILREPMVVEEASDALGAGEDAIRVTPSGPWFSESKLIPVTDAPAIELWAVKGRCGDLYIFDTEATAHEFVGSSELTLVKLIAFEGT